MQRSERRASSAGGCWDILRNRAWNWYLYGWMISWKIDRDFVAMELLIDKMLVPQVCNYTLYTPLFTQGSMGQQQKSIYKNSSLEVIASPA